MGKQSSMIWVGKGPYQQNRDVSVSVQLAE